MAYVGVAGGWWGRGNLRQYKKYPEQRHVPRKQRWTHLVDAPVAVGGRELVQVLGHGDGRQDEVDEEAAAAAHRRAVPHDADGAAHHRDELLRNAEPCGGGWRAPLASKPVEKRMEIAVKHMRVEIQRWAVNRPVNPRRRKPPFLSAERGEGVRAGGHGGQLLCITCHL